MVEYNIENKKFIIYAEGGSKLAEVTRNEYFKEYTVVLYSGWDRAKNVDYALMAINSIMDNAEEEELLPADLIKAQADPKYGWEMALGADLEYMLREVKFA